MAAKTISMILLLWGFVGQAWVQEKKLAYKDDHFPLHPGNVWVYAQGKNSVTISVVKQEFRKARIRDPQGNEKVEDVWCSLLQIAGGDPSPQELNKTKQKSTNRVLNEHVAVLGDGVYRFSTAGKEIAPPLQILKLPPGNHTWECLCKSEGATLRGKFKSTSVDDVKVPAFPQAIKGAIYVSCPELEITQAGLPPLIIGLEFWFAHNVGMVKQVVKMDNEVRVMELKEYKLVQANK